MRNSSLWSDVVFWEISNFPLIWFWDLKFRTWGLKIKHQKAYKFVWRRVFFHRFVILCIWWDTPSEETGLWQLSIVSSVFKHNSPNQFDLKATLAEFVKVVYFVLNWQCTKWHFYCNVWLCNNYVHKPVSIL